jgi:hypothetical protein
MEKYILDSLNKKIKTTLKGNQLTNPQLKSDGFGVHFQMILYTMMYCEYYSLEFVYSPIKYLEHNYENDPLFLVKKEVLMNVATHYPICNDPSIQSLNIVELLSFYEKNLTFCINSRTLQNIKHIFRYNKTNPYSRDKKHIAIHIRRMNACDRTRLTNDDGLLEGMDVPDSLYLELIDQLKTHFPDSIFHIYSQGDIQYFQNIYTQKNIVLHIDEPVEETFIGLVYADILITGPSAFSYVAGLISNGDIFYISFCHPPLPHWSIIQGYKNTRKHAFLMDILISVEYDAKKEEFVFPSP